jgi:hypothetical protein
VSDPGAVDVVLLRRSHVLRNAGLATTLVCCALSFLMHGELRLAWCLLGMSGLGLVFLGRESSVRRVPARACAEGVRAGAAFVAPRRTIRSGWAERTFEGSRVHLDRGMHPDLEVEAADDAEAVRILRALGCDPSQTVVRFPSAYRFVALAGAAGMLGQFCGHALPGGSGHLSTSMYLLSVAVYLLWPLWIVVLGTQETAVGSDGVFVSGPFRSRFVPFADVEAVVVESIGKLVLHTRSGGRVVRRMRGPAAEAAAELIQSAIASSHDGSEAVRLQLRRVSDGDVGAWLARLRALAAQAPYRAQAFGGDALWRVVVDPNATGVERAAAAVVLGTSGTPTDRARLRDAASRMASPRVRTAIQQITDGANEDELAVALEALEEAEAIEALGARDSAA